MIRMGGWYSECLVEVMPNLFFSVLCLLFSVFCSQPYFTTITLCAEVYFAVSSLMIYTPLAFSDAFQ